MDAHGAPLGAVIARGMKVAPVQIAKAIVAPMQVGAICKGNASVLMQIANAHSLGGGLDGGLDDESCTVSRSLPSSPIISTLFTLSRLKSARLVQSGLSASTPNPWHCNGPFSTLQFVTQMYFCILYFLYLPSLSEVASVQVRSQSL